MPGDGRAAPCQGPRPLRRRARHARGGVPSSARRPRAPGARFARGRGAGGFRGQAGRRAVRAEARSARRGSDAGGVPGISSAPPGEPKGSRSHRRGFRESFMMAGGRVRRAPLSPHPLGTTQRRARRPPRHQNWNNPLTEEFWSSFNVGRTKCRPPASLSRASGPARPVWVVSLDPVHLVTSLASPSSRPQPPTSGGNLCGPRRTHCFLTGRGISGSSDPRFSLSRHLSGARSL